MTKPRTCPPGRQMQCPEGSRRVTTKGRGRGWNCIAEKAVPGKGWFRPYVRGTCR